MSEKVQTMKWTRIDVDGDDAVAYLQGQLTQDLTLIDTAPRWSLLLNPDSVVVSSCLVSVSTHGISMVVEQELAENTLVRLRRFLLRSKCDFQVVEDIEGPFATVAQRVIEGWPGAPEFAKALTPHSFGATLVKEAVSFTKGCFTGQELVGRLDARGSNLPWRLARISGASAEWSDDWVRSIGPSGPQGVTTSTVVDGTSVVLAIVHRSLLADGAPQAPPEVVMEAIA